MDLDLFFWIVARISGLASFMTLAIALGTGVALRTSVLDWLSNNRAMKALHEFTTPLWLPLAAIHVATIILDRTARVSALDVVVPFRVSYAPLAIGLGTLTLDIFVLVVVTSWLRRHMDQTLWRWIHRLSYVAFAAVFLHAVWAGTDFSQPAVSALAWSTAFALAVLSVARILWGRLPV